VTYLVKKVIFYPFLSHSLVHCLLSVVCVTVIDDGVVARGGVTTPLHSAKPQLQLALCPCLESNPQLYVNP